MKSISIYVENARLTPSSYYRLTQYFSPSEARMHSVLPDCIYRLWHRQGKYGRMAFGMPLYVFYVFRTLRFLIGDALSIDGGTVIFSRAIVPRRMPALHKFLIRKLGKKNMLVWDFDDNILANRRIPLMDFRFFSEICDTIVVTGDNLLALIDPAFSSKVRILPTTDGDMLNYDTAEIFSRRQALYSVEVRLVWVATATGLDYLRPVIPLLDETAKAVKEQSGKKLSLHIVCNKPLKAKTSYVEVVNVRWGREVAKHEILNSHIGLMPLPDTEFTRGKGGFKLIQYMSAAMPVIASPVGINNQIVTTDIGFLVNDNAQNGLTWKDAIMKMSSSWEYYVKLSQNAKERYDSFYSFDKNKDFWTKLVSVK